MMKETFKKHICVIGALVNTILIIVYSLTSEYKAIFYLLTDITIYTAVNTFRRFFLP